MKTLALSAIAALAIGTAPALAQTSNTRQAPAQGMTSPAPSFQQGSGQQSGGPAKELIPETGDPAATGTVTGSGAANTRQAPAQGMNAPVPSFQQGSGQQSGGPAKELNPK